MVKEIKDRGIICELYKVKYRNDKKILVKRNELSTMSYLRIIILTFVKAESMERRRRGDLRNYQRKNSSTFSKLKSTNLHI